MRNKFYHNMRGAGYATLHRKTNFDSLYRKLVGTLRSSHKKVFRFAVVALAAIALFVILSKIILILKIYLFIYKFSLNFIFISISFNLKWNQIAYISKVHILPYLLWKGNWYISISVEVFSKSPYFYWKYHELLAFLAKKAGNNIIIIYLL